VSVSAEATDIRMVLPARPENVALVRQVLSGVADVLPVEPTLLADMKTAVTEACNNVVLHAYPDEGGTLEFDASPDQECVTVVVRDHGEGMQPRPVEPEEPSLGLGLPLIAALSDRFEISGGTGLGVEVRMRFRVDAEADLEESVDMATDAPPPPRPTGAARAAGVAISPGPMMAAVLGRLTAMFAARADFPLDRLSDAVLVTDALSAHIGAYLPGPHALVHFQDGDDKVVLRVGPLVEGGGDQLVRHMELPGLELSLAKLVDELKVERGTDGANGLAEDEYLLVRISG
jgi:anti-sigma regulatory factor (Ser/Thr protein kinase)